MKWEINFSFRLHTSLKLFIQKMKTKFQLSFNVIKCRLYKYFLTLSMLAATFIIC